jgi:hypothetical protein
MSLVAQILYFFEAASALDAREVSPIEPAATAMLVKKFLLLRATLDSLGSALSSRAGQELFSDILKE